MLDTDMILNEYSIGVKVGARRQGEGGHSGGATLMVVQRRVMFDRQGGGRGEVGVQRRANARSGGPTRADSHAKTQPRGAGWR